VAYTTDVTDVTDAQFALVAPLLPAPPRLGRPRVTHPRRVLDALCADCAWRLLPREYPPWQTVYRYLRAWERDGTWQHVHEALRRAVRVAAGRPADPPVGIADSQSAKSTERGAPRLPPAKRVLGRKRHFLVDTLGLLIATRVEPTNLHDQRGARALLGGLRPLQPRLAAVYADSAYAGAPPHDWCAARVGVELRVVRRPSATASS